MSTKRLKYINIPLDQGRRTVSARFLRIHLQNWDYIAGATQPYIILNFTAWKSSGDILLCPTVYT